MNEFIEDDYTTDYGGQRTASFSELGSHPIDFDAVTDNLNNEDNDDDINEKDRSNNSESVKGDENDNLKLDTEVKEENNEVGVNNNDDNPS